MPYEKNLNVKHLNVKESEKVPTKVLSSAIILYGEDSGKVITIPTLTNPFNVILPSAYKGRYLKLVLNPTNDGQTLSQTVTLNVKNSGEYFNAQLLTLVINNNQAVSQYKNTASSTMQITDIAYAGSVVNLVCTVDGVWTVTGYGISATTEYALL